MGGGGVASGASQTPLNTTPLIHLGTQTGILISVKVYMYRVLSEAVCISMYHYRQHTRTFVQKFDHGFLFIA
jgi:hypothetical protein